ncbi:hypothetical protein [Advenella mimigardefordensis]|uniref:Putative ethyl tert-butyl ether degradation EthD n=1 Tax=Advenella mimigardefordensis (strain DSM 17166 / LMG 22922 / DPN7) TaxID=1247726 RepID=W0PIH7_ADVMD|nr:hypothetical protein [Advenella mimigardefordensis]AHG65230.1 putative ethyl tert-butyl ether degradation EthD [Advenella mimigardefordensis DPN7]
MNFVHILTFRSADAASRISADDEQSLRSFILDSPGLLRAHFHTPSAAKDYYTDDGHSPVFVVEAYYQELQQLETNLAEDGYLQGLNDLGQWPSLQACECEHQVMMSRPFPVLEAREDLLDSQQCSYLVHYPGEAEDFFSWLNYYLSHHPQIMKFFPGIRAIEIYTRVDWIDALSWQRANYMQRNKLVFDSPDVLTAALNSPVRHDMRADFEKFPAFTGENRHFAMLTTSVTK